MLREPVSVIRHDLSSLVLEAGRHRVCSSCSLKGGCSHYRLIPNQDVFEVSCDDLGESCSSEEFRAGEQVLVALDERQFLYLVGLFYGVPLAGLMLATLFAVVLNGGESLLISSAMGGLATGLLLSRSLMRSPGIRSKVGPRILRVAARDAAETLSDGSTK